MASVKFIGVSRGLKDILDYVTNREKTTDALITGVNCVAQTALDEFETVKKQFRKTDGRGYYHIVQAFSPDDPLDFETAHEIGLQFAAFFPGYQCVVVTHMNTKHIHNHIVMNSVNFETGMKFHQSAQEMRQVKEFSNQLCQRYELSITETKADPFEIPEWKKRLRRNIKRAMELSYDREDFLMYMEAFGYKVKWEPGQKYITYTTPENQVCRDRKLFDQTLKVIVCLLELILHGTEQADDLFPAEIIQLFRSEFFHETVPFLSVIIRKRAVFSYLPNFWHSSCCIWISIRRMPVHGMEI